MSTIVLLSSSPPRVFARSPTPARSSSPTLPSPSAILNGNAEARRRFNSAAAQRDGFTGGFTSPGALRRKSGAENLPVMTQRRQEIAEGLKSSQEVIMAQASKNKSSAKLDGKVPERNLTSQQRQQGSERDNLPNHTGKSRPIAGKAKKLEKRELGPLLLEKASSRRLDWTPPKPTAPASTESPVLISPSRSFPARLGSFSYNHVVTKEAIACRRDEAGGPTKRRRLELVDMTNIPAPRLAEKTSMEPPVALKKRPKSPAKKYTTITGLATSHYQEKELGLEKVSPMSQCLTAIQARAAQDSEEILSDTARPKPKRAPRKNQKATSRFKVLSPQSAMKAFDSQEMMFGSASQLARDESPIFIRDALEDMKQSVSFSMSDPISTQRTQPISTESTTPRIGRGTARYTKARNLWSAAGRDEDNALLHIDTVDLFDTPDLRLAFAGKDVLLEPEAPRQRQPRSPEKHSPLFRGGQLLLPNSGLICHDIDDITTPVACNSSLQARGLHTSAKKVTSCNVGSGEEASSLITDQNSASVGLAGNSKVTAPATRPQFASNPKPKKPSYAGFATHDLQKQILAYGFKPIKKREKMIEVLDRCWDDKQGSTAEDVPNSEPARAESVEALTHGDILSKVHDISCRPVPKVKKLKEKPKDKADTAKSPKRRKAEPKVKAAESDATIKVSRKRNSKAGTLSEEVIVDIDDIEDLAIEPAKAKSPSKQKLTSKTASQPLPRTNRLASLPPTPPETVSSCPAFETLPPSHPLTTTNAYTTTPSTVPSFPLIAPDLSSQITRAITTFVAPKDLNHRTNPTWHEKILMYDPIVLEDLAAWLNTEGLSKIGEDRKVSAMEVRSWCDARAICCLWRGGWRGNKARKGEDEED
jgi:Slx4 endonuclease